MSTFNHLDLIERHSNLFFRGSESNGLPQKEDKPKYANSPPKEDRSPREGKSKNDGKPKEEENPKNNAPMENDGPIIPMKDKTPKKESKKDRSGKNGPFTQILIQEDDDPKAKKERGDRGDRGDRFSRKEGPVTQVRAWIATFEWDANVSVQLDLPCSSMKNAETGWSEVLCKSKSDLQEILEPSVKLVSPDEFRRMYW
jgi:hypothetical protein